MSYELISFKEKDIKYLEFFFFFFCIFYWWSDPQGFIIVIYPMMHGQKEIG